MATYTASIKSETMGGATVVIGRTDGASAPVYEWIDDEYGTSERILGRYLEDAYRQGLYSTGSIGEVRDMLNAMARTTELCMPGDLTLETPEESATKAAAEAEKFWADLPEGAVP